VVGARARWVADRGDTFARHVRRISAGSEGRVEYDSTLIEPENAPAGDEAGIADRFRRELARVGEREERRGMTLVGPHRDDLRIRASTEGGAGWVDLRTYGSGGQQRTAAVALRMIEAESLRAASRSEPVILLDDVFAELDPGRSLRILEWVEEEEGGQVILTAPKPSDFGLRGGALPRWRIEHGVVRPL
jgi:DNA replication and repair protein RecF